MAACPICPNAEREQTRVVFDVKSDGGVESSWGVKTERALVYECANCGLRFRTPPEASAVLDFYGQQYHERMVGGVDDVQRELQHRRENDARIRYLKLFTASGRVLDVGCSLGHLAKQLEQAGFDVMGSDISAFACERAERLLGAGKVLHGPIEGFADRFEGAFDAITMLDVIEHFVDVVAPLTGCLKMLKPSGVLFLRTPTLSSPFHQIAELCFRASGGLYRTPILKLYHGEHLFYFNENSIRRVLERVGFEVVDVAPDPLLWSNFRSAELRNGTLVDTAMAVVYFAGRAFKRGHGMRVVARRRTDLAQ